MHLLYTPIELFGRWLISGQLFSRWAVSGQLFSRWSVHWAYRQLFSRWSVHWADRQLFGRWSPSGRADCWTTRPSCTGSTDSGTWNKGGNVEM